MDGDAHADDNADTDGYACSDRSQEPDVNGNAEPCAKPDANPDVGANGDAYLYAQPHPHAKHMHGELC